jgi:hypothetical protein
MRAISVTCLVFATVLAALAMPAAAACKKFAFEVNDYGKDGPTRDAKSLLDKHIAEWAKQQGIKNYTVGKKDVTCELFLNLLVVDEHTCRAVATVCWQGADPSPAAPVAKPPRPAAKPKAAARQSRPS